VGGGIVVAAELVTLDGVEVTGNEAVDGGGIAVLPGASLALVGGTTVHDNTALGAGGGIHSEDAVSLALSDSSVTQNLALQGGGLWLRGTATLESAAISDNHANDGGGVALDSSVKGSQLVGVHDAVLGGNSAVFGGGAWGTGDLVGMTIENNDAEHGGGVYATGLVGLFQSTVTGNEAAATYDGSGGGVMLPPGSSLVASDVALVGNVADGWGGAIMADSASFVVFGAELDSNVAEMGGGVALVGSCATCMLEGNAVAFRANVALRGGGDILVWAPGTTLELTDVLLHAAIAPTGAAISLRAGAVELLQSEVSAALSTEPDGAAIELAETDAWLGVNEGSFMGNDPADLRVLPLDAEAAPGSTFTCVGGTGCIVGP
jgi:predicted outer membrane repeat protein